MSKLLENIFRSVNIALVNELGLLSHRMGMDIWEVVDAAATKPYGFMRFEPGPGMGGHCLPVDPFYLTWRAREFHMATEFIELAGKINQQMPSHCVERIERALNEAGQPIQGSRSRSSGLATRVARAISVNARAADHQELTERGAVVSYHDPFVPELTEFGLTHSELDTSVDGTDAVVLVTAHPGIDYEALAEHAAVFVDLRGVTRRSRPDSSRSTAEALAPLVSKRIAAPSQPSTCARSWRGFR